MFRLRCYSRLFISFLCVRCKISIVFASLYFNRFDSRCTSSQSCSPIICFPLLLPPPVKFSICSPCQTAIFEVITKSWRHNLTTISSYWSTFSLFCCWKASNCRMWIGFPLEWPVRFRNSESECEQYLRKELFTLWSRRLQFLWLGIHSNPWKTSPRSVRYR
jgi:hypothetical protein